MSRMQASLESIPDNTRRVFVAYSGGLDSSVLLHLLTRERRSYEIRPWHVNHGLIDVAAQMEQFCVDQARRLGLEIRIDRLEPGEIETNVEAEARSRRYHLFRQHCREGDCILTAHHADDQAETFLLNALRGSGVAGLRGIASERHLGAALLLRPLLAFSRAQLEDYATRHEIAWFNDPSNRSLRYDRNYLRHEIVPLLKHRWPGLITALSTSCEIQSETQNLLEEIAAADYRRLRSEPLNGIATLDVQGLLALTLPRRKNLLRYWVKQAGFASIPHARLHELLLQLHARADAQPEIVMPDCSIRVYDRRLFLVAGEESPDISGEFEFGQDSVIEIEALELRLGRAEIFDRLGIDDRGQSLSLKFRRSGERNSDRHRLKRLFQKHNIPPWQRDRIAQVYLDGNLEGLLT
ncbi:MAG TPA: tRNA lysidine(34) synthetase TilS [Gammaproteobacteria bacterium]|nr:tRNA lysidine(34) synthetase TilS [Gammaproteobacteria bacterium]